MCKNLRRWIVLQDPPIVRCTEENALLKVLQDSQNVWHLLSIMSDTQLQTLYRMFSCKFCKIHYYSVRYSPANSVQSVLLQVLQDALLQCPTLTCKLCTECSPGSSARSSRWRPRLDSGTATASAGWKGMSHWLSGDWNIHKEHSPARENAMKFKRKSKRNTHWLRDRVIKHTRKRRNQHSLEEKKRGEKRKRNHTNWLRTVWLYTWKKESQPSTNLIDRQCDLT